MNQKSLTRFTCQRLYTPTIARDVDSLFSLLAQNEHDK